MTDQTARDVVTEAIRSGVCCDGSDDAAYWYFEESTLQGIADTVLDALRAARVAVIPLPEPREITVLKNAWWLDGDVTAVVGSGRVRCELDDHRMSSGAALELAAALLAAAAVAEDSQ